MSIDDGQVTIQDKWTRDVKPLLESLGVKGAIEGIIAAGLGLAFGASAAAYAHDVFSAVIATGSFVAGGIGLFGSIRALVGRLRASQRVG